LSSLRSEVAIYSDASAVLGVDGLNDLTGWKELELFISEELPDSTALPDGRRDNRVYFPLLVGSAR
jgi:hypothetical protein